MHDITHDDVWLAPFTKEVNVADGERWEEPAVLVTDDEAVSSWESNPERVKSPCKVKRARCVEFHAFPFTPCSILAKDGIP